MTIDAEDEQAIREVLEGRTESFALLVERHQRLVAKVVSKHVPRAELDEVCQRVFIRIYRSLKNFRGEGAFPGWVAKLAVRESYDFWREHFRRGHGANVALEGEHRELLERVLSTEALMQFEDAARRRLAKETLDRALSSLTPEERFALSLVYFEERSIAEAADVLGWSRVNLKVRLLRARRKLRRLIEGQFKGA